MRAALNRASQIRRQERTQDRLTSLDSHRTGGNDSGQQDDSELEDTWTESHGLDASIGNLEAIPSASRIHG
jgi:hypothetical protein